MEQSSNNVGVFPSPLNVLQFLGNDLDGDSPTREKQPDSLLIASSFPRGRQTSASPARLGGVPKAFLDVGFCCHNLQRGSYYS